MPVLCKPSTCGYTEIGYIIYLLYIALLYIKHLITVFEEIFILYTMEIRGIIAVGDYSTEQVKGVRAWRKRRSA